MEKGTENYLKNASKEELKLYVSIYKNKGLPSDKLLKTINKILKEK